MSLKRQQNIQATFSMASMTDVIFLLLVFFMVTSTFVFPTALDITLPQSSEQTALKPSTQVYIDAEGNISASYGDAERRPFTLESLPAYLIDINKQDPENSIAIYADAEVPYGRIVDVLNVGAQYNMKMVLATRPVNSSASSAEAAKNGESTSDNTVPQP